MRGARELLRADACQIYRLDVEADELALVGSEPDGRARAEPPPRRRGLVLELMRRANGGGRGNGRRVARALWPDVDERALLVAPLIARDEQLGLLCCLAARPPVHRRGRGAAGRGRRPDRRGAEEGRADRAVDRGEHRQGHVRRARRRFGEGGGGEGERGAVRPRRARTCSCTSSARREPTRALPPWPGSRPGSRARLRRLYPRAFFDSRHDRVRALAPMSARRRRARPSSCARPASRSRARTAS